MSLFREDLEQIAQNCISSEEFTERAHKYFKMNGWSTPPIDDCGIRDIYRQVDLKRQEKAAWEKYNNTIEPALLRRVDCKGLWYETWIDLSETWLERWFASFCYMNDEQIIDACAKYLNERERFYGSPDYYDMLDKMVADIKFDK